MTRRLLTAVALSAFAVATVATPGTATHGGIHPTFAPASYYFECEGGDANKVQNLDSPAPFGTTAPTRSYTAGAGCGVVDPGALVNTQPSGGPADAAFSGTVTGNVRNITVRLWLLGHTNYSPLLPADVDIWLVVNGEHYVPEGTWVEMIPWVASSTGASRYIEFTITDLGWTKDIYDEEGELVDVLYGGVVADDGPGTTGHEVQLTIGQHYSDEAGAWVWGASEIASGFEINDATPAAKQVSAGQLPPP